MDEIGNTGNLAIGTVLWLPSNGNRARTGSEQAKTLSIADADIEARSFGRPS